MAEKYEKSMMEITAGGLLRIITAYNLMIALSAPAPGWDTIIRAAETTEYHYRKSTISELAKTLEVDSTQIDVFGTLLEKRIK